MHDWQDRVIQEKLDLDMRIAKLEAFISGDEYAALDPLARDLLRSQANYMRAYSSTLAHRIERFDSDEAP